jgi:hypothetical protein
MSRFLTFWIPLAAGLMAAGSGSAREPYFRLPFEQEAAPAATTVPPAKSGLAAYLDDEAVEAPADEVKQPDFGCDEPACGCEPSCDCESSCGCEPSCGCENGCCNGGCDSGWGSCLGDCCLGDAWTLQGYLQPCCDKTYVYGGWMSWGYYNHSERLSREDADALSFNDFPHEFGADQVWFYTEKVAEADACSADWGYRFDIMYGRHGHTAQAYGNDGGTWDVTFDHGHYEWALPQLYLELAHGDWSWKLGKWFTPVGYEVIPDTGNFFYSHTLTHYNSEPFSHTGVLGTYNGFDDATV